MTILINFHPKIFLTTLKECLTAKILSDLTILSKNRNLSYQVPIMNKIWLNLEMQHQFTKENNNLIKVNLTLIHRFNSITVISLLIRGKDMIINNIEILKIRGIYSSKEDLKLVLVENLL